MTIALDIVNAVLLLFLLLAVGAVLHEVQRSRVAATAILARIREKSAEEKIREADAEIEAQIDELYRELWAKKAEAEGWIPPRPRDQ